MKSLTSQLLTLTVGVAILASTPRASAQEAQPYLTPSIERAHMYMQHGLPDDAKRMAISLVFDAADPKVRLDAHMFLAHVAVHEGRVDDALEVWRDIIAQHSGSAHADEARQLLPIANEVRSSQSRHFAGNARAELYFASAREWSNRTSFDRTHLPVEEAAATWYTMIAEEFPGSRDAERAMRDHAITLLGGVQHLLSLSNRKVEEQQRYNRQLDALRKLMGKFQQKFPDSPYLSRTQYKIADAFFGVGRKVEAEPWLREIREREGSLTFWKQIAQLRDQFWSGR